MNAIYQWEGLTPMGHWIVWSVACALVAWVIINHKQQGRKVNKAAREIEHD